MKTALIITTYNRPELLKQCLDSLLKADLSGVVGINVYDDCSDNLMVLQHITDFQEVLDDRMPQGCNETLLDITNVNAALCILNWREKNIGIKQNLLQGCNELFKMGYGTLITLDPDTIVTNDFVNRLLDLKARFPEHIISGFNCNHPKNPVLESHEDYVMRKHANGLNMCFDRQQYESIIKPALMGNGNWDYASTHNKPFVICKPSVIEHMGATQSTLGHTNGDVSCDFKHLHLPDVTIFGVDSHDPAGLLRAYDISTRHIKFGAEKIITEKLFSGREAYSEFCIKSMHKYVDTSHVLIIHPDGYVLNWQAWRDEWLQYCYIGSPWEWFTDDYKNGNGGFSLRSKKLLNALAQMDIKNTHPEDEVLARKLRPVLENDFGIKFAPIEVCRQFGIEAWGVKPPGNKYNGQFGFHGYSVDFSTANIPDDVKLKPKRPPRPTLYKKSNRALFDRKT